MRWLVDTSAWARRDIPEIAEQIAAILAEDPRSELALSGPVLLELLRGPQGAAVAAERRDLESAMVRVALDEQIVTAAADAMVRLAEHAPDAHRLPVADLLTAALADRHRCGIIHVDAHFGALARHSGLTFEHRQLHLPPVTPDRDHPAARQRQLRRDLAQLLHRLPAEDAERLLERSIAEARQAAGADSASR